MMKYDYVICGIHVRFDIPWKLKITEETHPFLAAAKTDAEPDWTVEFAAVEFLPAMAPGGVWVTDAYYLSDRAGKQVWHCPSREEQPYCCVKWDGANVLTCYYVPGQEQHIIYTKNLLELLGLEWLLLQFDGILLHASLVAWEGKGILFCAPSGTGKSTQARLWQRYCGSRTLNGDRAGIRCEEGVWKAWGLPFAGTSGIYRNESVTIRAVVLLCQGNENSIVPVRPLDAFKGLFPQCNARRWDGDFMDRLTQVLSELVGAVPCYRLTCRPDQEAVELLRDVIVKEA